MSTANATAPLPVETIRQDFPILNRQTSSGAELAFLDNAASSQRPDAVIDAISACYRSYYANVHRGIHTLSEEATDAYEQARRCVAAFIHAREPETIFTAGTTAGINLVAHSWGSAHLSRDDTILLTIAEHHANIVPWQQLAERCGCRIEFLPLNDEFTIESAAVSEALEKFQPKVFAFTAASNVLGTRFPVAEWTRLAHAAGAVVVVDAAQLAPHEPLDVRAWDADFVVFGGHKMCGPTGIGVLYGKESWLESMPPFLGGGGMISRVTTAGFQPGELPDKFEAGTPPIAEAIGLRAAIEYLQRVGLEAIAAHEHQLLVKAETALRAIEGVRIIGPAVDRKLGIISFDMQHAHAHDVAQLLDSFGIAVRAGHHCTMPLHHALGLTATTRASFYLYNTLEEVDRLVAAIEQAQRRFAPTGRRRRRRVTE